MYQSFKGLIQAFLLITLTVVVSSCVPKATEKNAVCGTNQAFNNITRTCYSIAEVRYKPVGTLSTQALTQETPALVTLSYTDGNNDSATSCNVSSISSNLEIFSPTITDGSFATKAEDLYNAITSLKAVFHVYYLSNTNSGTQTVEDSFTLVTGDYKYLQDDLSYVQNSYYISTIESKATDLQARATSLVTAVSAYTGDASVNYYYTLSQNRLTTFSSYVTAATNKCACSGGVCKTYVVPKKNFSGSAGFSYTITDIDGASTAKSVSGTVTAYARTKSFYAPAIESTYVSSTESYTSTPSTYAFSLGTARDYFATSSFTYSHGKTVKTASGGISGYSSSSTTYVDSDSALGKITACMGLGGSSSTDTSCVYVPNSGDTYDALTPIEAQVSIGTAGTGIILYKAVAKGTAGNNFKIQYVDISTDLTAIDGITAEGAKYGLVSSTEAIIRVIGNTIYVIMNEGTTTAANIATLINSDSVAKTLVSATVTTAGSPQVADASTATSLAGGIDGYDTFTYYVNNGYLTSTSSAKAAIHFTSVIDYPSINAVATRSATFNENTPSRGNDTATVNIDLTSTFIATDGVTTCSVNTLTINSNLAAVAPSCSCVANVCTATLHPAQYASSSAAAFTFDYSICSASGCTSDTTYSVYLTPVNDVPSMTGLPATASINENSTATPTAYSTTLTLSSGGGTFESTQTFTLAATSSDTTVIPNANIVFTGTGSSRTMTVTPVQNLSSATPITISVTLTDNGGTTGCNVITTCNTQTYTMDLTVVATNDPPYFVTSVANVQSNEGGYIIAGPFKVDEDTANSADENADGITLTATSDNQSILMDSGIRIFFDSNDNGVEDSGEVYFNGTATTRAQLEAAAADDIRAHNFYIKLTPVGGTSGSANVTLSATDGTAVASPAQTTTKTFSFVVNSVSAIHNGWTNISATGLKTDKYGAPANPSDLACNYNKSTDTNNCNGGSNCTGTSAPYSSITTTASNVLYWDSSNKKCYISYQSGASYLWKQFSSSCPVTRTSTMCSGNNCFVSGTGVASSSTPTTDSMFYYNLTDNLCYKSKVSGTGYAWGTIPYYPAKVSIAWKAFTLTGSGSDMLDTIKGYNVYRREAGTDYNFVTGFLKTNSTDAMTLTGSSTLTYTDTTAEAGKVYFYQVRPVDSNHSLPTYTTGVFSEIRLIAPPRNMSFVHRWMINQEVCNKMHMTTSTTNKVDPSHNFRCPYYGPGSNAGYYDYGKDLLVDISEMGCPYTLNSAGGHCSNGTSGCIGIGDPTTQTLSNVQDKDVYYDRDGGACYVYDLSNVAGLGASTWVEYNAAPATLVQGLIAGTFDPYGSALNPPLVNVDQTAASNLCTDRLTPTIYKTSSTTMAALGSMALPEKKDYMAYSAAPLTYNGSAITDSQIADIEQGDSLNVQSRCNGSSASGLTSYYDDSNLPTSSYMFTVPGTASSNIRSIYTGSIPWGYNYGTEACVSRYGVQDVYGNVAEWTKDQMLCDGSTYVCAAQTGTDLYYDMYDGTVGNAYDHLYGFDLFTGPYNDANGSGLAGDLYSSITDSFLTDWDLADESFDATKFSFPLGLPMYTNYTNLISCSYTKQVAGNCSVDGVNGCIGSGDPSTLTFTTAQVANDIYLDHSSGKCYKRNSGNTAWNIITPSASVYSGLDFILDIGSSNGITYSQLHGDGFIVNGQSVYDGATHRGGFAVGGSYLSGARSGRYTTELVPVADKRVDVGLRCILPIDKTKYPTSVEDPFHSYSY